MAMKDHAPEVRYDALVEPLLGEPGVTRAEKRGFGSSGLFVAGKLFVFLGGDRLVVKILANGSTSSSGPATASLRSGSRPGHEGVAEPRSESDVSWPDLAREAAAFVGRP